MMYTFLFKDWFAQGVSTRHWYREREGRIIVIHKVIPHALGSTLQKLWCKADKDLQEGKRARFTWSRTVMTI